MTLQRILVATDMSPRSDRAVQRAFDIARQKSVSVTVLTVLDDAMPPDLTHALHDRTRELITRYVSSVGKGVKHHIISRVGDPTAEILNEAQNDPEHLLVMGVHRPRLFLDALRETTMQRIVRRTANPVLLVKDAADHSYEKVISACDFSPASTASLKLALELSPTARPRIVHALHVPYSGVLGQKPGIASDIEQAFRKEAAEDEAQWRASGDVPDAAGETETIVGPPFGILRHLAEQGEADLIAVGAHGRVGAARSVLGSLSVDLMRDPPCDVLITRP